MRPGDAVLDIAFEELRRGDRAAFARADILHVGDRAVDQLVVGGREREAPQLVVRRLARGEQRSEEHTSELQSLMRISYAVFCLKKKNKKKIKRSHDQTA